MKKNKKVLKHNFESFAAKATKLAGQPIAFIVAFAIVMFWAVSGTLFKFSDTWQLVINTGTTIITFLMVFIIQQTQNKDSHAIQLKLNEIVAAMKGASNKLINVEDLTEDELHVLHKLYQRLSDIADQDEDIGKSLSIKEAEMNQQEKGKQAHKPS